MIILAAVRFNPTPAARIPSYTKEQIHISKCLKPYHVAELDIRKLTTAAFTSSIS
jgi:hypothetical protein